MSPSRRTMIKLGLGAGATLVVNGIPSFANAQQAALITKPIPSTGEKIPVIGLGSSQTFNLTAGSADYNAARDVIKLFKDLGGKVIDTAPSYQNAEPFIGETIQSFKIQNDLFLATKVNVGEAPKQAALDMMENSSRVFGKRVIDLMQVWNLGDSIRNLTDNFLPMHMEAVQEWKKAGRARYIGITTSRDPQYGDVEEAMKKYTIDFVQLDYSIGDRIPEERLLPLAKEKGIAILANRPFSTGGLFRTVAGKPVPAFAKDYDINSWAQFFLKFIVSHPAVTCAIPATNDAAHLRDNMLAGVGRLPDEAARKKMVEAFAAL
jgi:diketogulonate reductase-like aldo/keto reductase